MAYTFDLKKANWLTFSQLSGPKAKSPIQTLHRGRASASALVAILALSFPFSAFGAAGNKCVSVFSDLKTKTYHQAFFQKLDATATEASAHKNRLAQAQAIFELMKLEDQGFLKKQPAIDAGAEHISLAEAMFMKPEMSFEAHLIRKYLHNYSAFYNPHTGHLQIDRVPSYKLSLENGRQKLSQVRINYTGGMRANAVLRDYARANFYLPDLKVVILSAKEDLHKLETELSRYPKEFRRQVTVLPMEDAYGHSLWAQDSSKPIDQKTPTTLVLEPHGVGVYKVQDQKLAEKTVTTVAFPVKLQGGNIIVGDRHALIGPEDLETTMDSLALEENDARKFLAKALGKEVLVMGAPGPRGNLVQRSFHIDLDLVLAVDQKTGIEHALVRSPYTLLRELAGAPSVAAPSLNEFLNLKQIILAKFQEKARSTPLTRGTLEFLITLNKIDPELVVLDELQGQFMARNLHLAGYPVQYVPGFGDINDTNRQGFFTGTNSILSGSKALIPGNDFPELEKMNQKMYETLGFETIVMASTQKTIECQGGIRCVSETFRQQAHP